MKLFWSWQADTPGNIGRFFVRDALIEAIDALKTDKDIVEPSEREARDAPHLDADRQGAPGSPDLAAGVFVADVTPVGATPDGKKLINCNVAIEYGYAHHALTDRSIPMAQNTHYGNRDQLRSIHKAGPIQNISSFTMAALMATALSLGPGLETARRSAFAARRNFSRSSTRGAKIRRSRLVELRRCVTWPRWDYARLRRHGVTSRKDSRGHELREGRRFSGGRAFAGRASSRDRRGSRRCHAR